MEKGAWGKFAVQTNCNLTFLMPYIMNQYELEMIREPV